MRGKTKLPKQVLKRLSVEPNPAPEKPKEKRCETCGGSGFYTEVDYFYPMRMLTCRDCKGTGYKPIELLTREIVKPLGDKRGWELRKAVLSIMEDFEFVYPVGNKKHLNRMMKIIEQEVAQTRQETIEEERRKPKGTFTGFTKGVGVCTCIYDRKGKIVGRCLRCMEMKLDAYQKGKRKTIDSLKAVIGEDEIVIKTDNSAENPYQYGDSDAIKRNYFRQELRDKIKKLEEENI